MRRVRVAGAIVAVGSKTATVYHETVAGGGETILLLVRNVGYRLRERARQELNAAPLATIAVPRGWQLYSEAALSLGRRRCFATRSDGGREGGRVNRWGRSWYRWGTGFGDGGWASCGYFSLNPPLRMVGYAISRYLALPGSVTLQALPRERRQPPVPRRSLRNEESLFNEERL